MSASRHHGGPNPRVENAPIRSPHITGGAAMDNTGRIIRTLGFAPAHDENAILEIAGLGLDAVGPDLEDLTPRRDKQRARELFQGVAKELAARGHVVMARVNTFENG